MTNNLKQAVSSRKLASTKTTKQGVKKAAPSISAEQASEKAYVPSRVFKKAKSSSSWYKAYPGVSEEFDLVPGSATSYAPINSEASFDNISIYAPSEAQFGYGVVATLIVDISGFILKGVQVKELEGGSLVLQVASRKDEASGKYFNHYEIPTVDQAQILTIVDALLEEL